MKKISLEHPLCDGYLGNTALHRRAALRMLLDSRAVYETPFSRKCKLLANAVLGFLFIACLIVSTVIITDWLRYDHNYDLMIKQIFKGNSKQVAENKNNIQRRLYGSGNGEAGRAEKVR
jgi:hypothetical protein